MYQPQRVHVAVESMPKLLGDIILGTLQQDEDFEVIESERTETEPGEVDVLMIGCDDARLTRDQERLLRSRPGMRILAIDAGGREAALYELRLHREPLRDLSPARLVRAVRSLDCP